MAIDRDETLRKAEKLLRQGNLPGAIAEYVRVADEFPADVNTLNKLAELYQRAGDTERAVVTFTRVADHWLREGTYGKAAAHYKKVLKLRPNDEAALLQLVQASIRQGSLVEAKGYLKIARDAREARGDRPGADQLTLQLADLDPSDFDAKLKGIRVRLAQEPSRSMVGEVRAAIAELEKAGRGAEAEDLLAGLIKLDPDNVDARVQVVEAAMRRGDDAAARAALPTNPEESHRPEVVALAAELELKASRVDAARPLLQRLLTLDRSRGRVTIRELGERLRTVDLSVAYACVEAVVEDQTNAREFVDASEALKRFLKLSKHHVPALLRLVEVAVDGDLDKDVTLAQRQLADAYLVEGEAMKARVIAEDLLSRDPRSLSERKRLHRALVALGEDDPDAIITELLSDQLGLGDDLTPVDDTEDDEAASESEAAAAPESGEETSGADARSDAHDGAQAASHADGDADVRGGAAAGPDADAGADTHAAAAPGDAGAAPSAVGTGVDVEPSGDRGDVDDGDDDRVLGAIVAGDGGDQPAVVSDAPHDAPEAFVPGETLAALDAFTPPDPLDALGPLGAVEPPPADALFPAPAEEPAREPAEEPELPPLTELPDLGAVAAHGTDAVPSPEVLDAPGPAAWPAPPAESDHGIAFEPEPVDFLPADPDLAIGDPDLPLAAGLGAEHGPDLLPAIEPPASGHVSPDGPVPAAGASGPGENAPGAASGRGTAGAPAGPAASAVAGSGPAASGAAGQGASTSPSGGAAVEADAFEDAEIDLTGALNALAKNGVSISEALDSVMPPPSAAAVAGPADQKFGGLPTGAEAFTPSGGPSTSAGQSGAPGASGGTGTAGKDAAHANGAGGGEETDLERVFDGLRSQAAGDMVEMAQPDQSLRLLSMADTYQAAGMFDEARAALEQVAADSRHRFRAAASLGRLFWQQGDADASLRWMELASEAPAPDREAGRALMYELGEKLEQTGETTRALAVFLELLGEQEDYRDVRQRVDRLSRVQAER